MYRLAGIFAAIFLLHGAAHSPAAAQDKTITVFAAASMKNALDDIDAAYTAKTGVKVAELPFPFGFARRAPWTPTKSAIGLFR